MIIPAIDIIDGQTVRLFQGDYKQKVGYGATPVELVQSYARGGCDVIHVVDLQGARDPSQRQIDLIAELAGSTLSLIQTGGGIRSVEDVVQLLDAGVGRVIVGSLAIKTPEVVIEWIQQFGPGKIVLALDVNIDDHGKRWLPTQAWQAGSGVELEPLLEKYLEVGIEHVLCTDISRDGTLSGSNTDLYKDLQAKYKNIRWQASGGIGSLKDIADVARTGVSGIIVGKALLDGKFTLKEARQCWLDA